ncbi:Uncharacterised protein [Serratia liquefaciens]|nr:Uncharacterised protein [Serratia liquefaciens]
MKIGYFYPITKDVAPKACNVALRLRAIEYQR